MTQHLIDRLKVAAARGPADSDNLGNLCRQAHERLAELEAIVRDVRDVLPELTAEASATVAGALGNQQPAPSDEPPRRRLMYAVGVEEEPGVYGLSHGPFSTRDEALAVDGGHESAVIVRFSPSGQEAVCFRWWDESWQREVH